MPNHPVSEKRLAANRANAAHSTGPRTPEGKARSAQNARKHGFTAANFSVVRLEDHQEIAALRDDLIAFYQPANSQQLFALERLAIAQQALLRIARFEAGLHTAGLNLALAPHSHELPGLTEELREGVEVTVQQNRNFAMAEGFRRINKESNTWSVFLRYQAQVERLYRRAVEDFDRIRALSPAPTAPPIEQLPNEPIPAIQPPENAPRPCSETNPPIAATSAATPVRPQSDSPNRRMSLHRRLIFHQRRKCLIRQNRVANPIISLLKLSTGSRRSKNPRSVSYWKYKR